MITVLTIAGITHFTHVYLPQCLFWHFTFTLSPVLGIAEITSFYDMGFVFEFPCVSAGRVIAGLEFIKSFGTRLPGPQPTSEIISYHPAILSNRERAPRTPPLPGHPHIPLRCLQR